MTLGSAPSLVDNLWADPDGDTVWTEWDVRGTRADGRPHRMCGPIVFTVREGLATAARFYLEPVDDPSGGGDGDADAAVQRIVS